MAREVPSELSQRSQSESPADLSGTRTNTEDASIPPRLQERLGNAVGICFNLGTWLSQLEFVSQEVVKNEIFDDVEIENTHPTVFVWGLSASAEST